ncbi:MAG: HEAT repeat domain-containing protein [Microcoleaceae cyanobacterium]
MNIEQIKSCLESENPQDRLKGLTELRRCDTDTAVPLLLSRIQDTAFIVRSFVAMGLGNKQSPEAFEGLLTLLKNDPDYNVRAEAANSLAKYGEPAVETLVQTFRKDDNWLVRRSILAPMMDMPYTEALYQICVCALEGEDLTVQNAALSGLANLADSARTTEALQLLLDRVNDSWWMVRAQVAKSLHPFKDPQAIAALTYLRKDEDHRVVGAALEGSLYSA